MVERNKLPMKSSQIQKSLDSGYGPQMDLVGFFYLPDILIGRTFYWLQFLLHLQCFTGFDVSFMLENLELLR